MITLHRADPAQAGVSPKRIQQLTQMCARWVADGSTPALVVLAARHGRIFLHQAWGNLAPEPGSQPVRLDTIFPVASVSKPVTATAVMMLVEVGRVGINQPLQKYLPEFQGPGCEQITVRHLLTHTSGLPYQSPGTPLEAGMNGLLHTPGSELVYSNAGYELLGELVQRVSGQSFDAFTRQQIFEPLGMGDTTFVHQGWIGERCVRRRAGTAFTWPARLQGQVLPSGSLWTTAADMAVFLQTFLNGGRYGDVRLLSPATVAAMTRNQVQGVARELINDIPNQPQGLGWFMMDGVRLPNTPALLSPTSYGHAGASGAFIWADPFFDLLGVFLFAKIRLDVHPLDCFVDAVMGSLVDPQFSTRHSPGQAQT